jgi:PAS domain S-box-containing protein
MAGAIGFSDLAREELNRRILDALPGGVVHVSADGAILGANAEALRVLGLSFDALTQKYTRDFDPETIWEDGSPCHVADYPVTKALATGEPQPAATIGVRRPDGSVAWAIFTAVPLRDPKTNTVTGAVVTFLDITARRAAEEALRKSEAHLRSIFESAPNPIVLADRDGIVRFINHTASPLEREAVIGKVAWEHVAPEDKAIVRETMEKVLATGEPARYEVRAGPEGHSFSVNVGPVRVGRDVVGTTFIAFDTTELRELQARLAASDRLASLGTLAAGIAHEVNNPLTYTLANMQWLTEYLERRPDAERAREWLRSALDGVQRIRDIVADLRSLTNDQADPFALTDVRGVIDTALRISSSELRHRARVTTHYPETVPLVAASASRLTQVFLNLLANAAHAIPEGNAEANEIAATVRVEGARVVVEISDTGAGIEPRLIGRIFEPFVTTKEPGVGTGLGLYISRSVVANLGGEISVRSALGKGTVFRVDLPAADSPPGPADRAPAPSLHPAGKRLRALVVDDEPAITYVVSALLDGHEVTVAQSGREAIAALEGGDFDVVFCDLVMPDKTGMDVYEFLRARRPGAERRVVFMTGGAFTDRARDFVATVKNTVLEKPFSAQALQDALARAVGA